MLYIGDLNALNRGIKFVRFYEYWKCSIHTIWESYLAKKHEEVVSSKTLSV